MPIYKGANQITKVYQGETEIDKVYRGASKVYGADKGTEITVSGNPLVLTNVAKEKALDTLEINGRTEQTQLQGYNLWQPNWLRTSIQNGVTLTNNGDGTYTLNGTCTESINFQYDINLNAGTYTLKANCTSIPVSSTSALLQVWSFSYGEGITVSNNNAISGTATITYSTDVVAVARVRVQQGVTYDNFIIKPQLEKGSVAHSYETYCGGIPSPNPDCPQEITNVQSVEVMQSGKNLLINGDDLLKSVNSYKVDNGYSVVTNTLYSATFGNKEKSFFQLPYKPNTQYTFSCHGVFNNNPTTFYVGWFNSDGVRNMVSTRDKEFDISVTLPSNKTAYGICFSYGTTERLTLSNIQIEQGTEATPYEPYKPIHTATIDGIELTKWDKIVKRNGVWGIAKNHYEYTVNRVSVFYTTSNPNGNVCYFSPPNYNKGVFSVRNFLCDKFVVSAESLDRMPVYSICGQSGASSTCWICLPKDITSAIEANQYLANNPAKLIYPTVAEQSFTPLSQTIQDQLNALQIVKPTTVVTNDKECEMSAKYLCYLDSTEAMLTSLYQNDLSEVLK